MLLQVNIETKRIEGYINECLGKPIAKKGCELVEVDSIPVDWQYCKYDKQFILDEEYKQVKQKELELIEIRLQREMECFPVVNRGILWYSMLTDEQVAELNTWYQAWLDVTETLVIPNKPSWI